MSAAARGRALITGIAGQDGSYLAELLCSQGREVHGVVRDRSADAPHLAAVRDQLELHEADLLRVGSLAAVVCATRPDEIYHLAAPAAVPGSWFALALTMRAIAAATGELIDAVREHAPQARVVIASSREIFGSAAPSPQNEDSPCRPTSPYGVAKLAGHQLVGLARQRDQLHLSSAILYNHESPRRSPEYVTRKVTMAAAAISLGRQQRLALGDLDAIRDWCAATDVVRGMVLMAAALAPADYVLASGVGHTVRELVQRAFAAAGLDAAEHVDVDPALVRASEPTPAIGDASRASERLGWHPRTSFDDLISEMVAADLERLRQTA